MYEKGTNIDITDFLHDQFPSDLRPMAKEILKETKKDEMLQIIKSIIQQGWPSEKHEAPTKWNTDATRDTSQTMGKE